MNIYPNEEETISIYDESSLNTINSGKKIDGNQSSKEEEIIEKTTSQKQKKRPITSSPKVTKLKKSSYKGTIDVINSNNSNKIHKKLLNFIWNYIKILFIFIWNYIKFLFINYNSIWMAFLGYFLGMFYTPDCKILITFICILIVTALSDYFVKIEKIELINKAKSEQKNMSNLENILNDSNVPDTSSIISKINSDLYTNQFNNNNKPSKP